ncbi:MAG TPA: tetratricopeptide repeat protein [Flavobacteriales bacterium]|nr:tetratricopeptide repeat protein [Flavobacteriales bacterium]
MLFIGSFIAATVSTAQSAQHLIAKGDSLLQLEKPQRAMEFFERAVEADPSAASHLARARAWYMLDRMDRFVLDVDKALRLDSSSAEAHYQRALYSIRAEDPAKAEYHAGQAIIYTKDKRMRAQAYILRGEARADLKHNAQAIEDFEAGLGTEMLDAPAMRTLARLYDATARHADALRVLERLCEMEPADVGHWTNRGYELIMLQRYDEALTMVERALEIDKDEPVALSNRAYIYLKMDRDKEAWSDVERSLRSYPSNAHALRTRAMLRLRKGEREKACEDLTLAKALGEVPDVDQLIKDNCASTPSPRKK